jgi:ubiquinone biosynthesis protein COQ4
MASQAAPTLAAAAPPAPSSSAPLNPGVPQKRDWRGAWIALRRLLANGDDTEQVFRIMRALNAGSARKSYLKLLAQPEGGRIAYRRVELAERFSDRAWVDTLPAGSVGAAYRAFLDRTGYSAQGLAEVSMTANGFGDMQMEHPVSWMGRRERDIHDIWHILTGYQADEHLGEASLVAFSYAQTGGLGWALIALGAAIKSIRVTGRLDFLRSVAEGWQRGRRTAWLHGEDYEALLAEPLAAARARLGIGPAPAYARAQTSLAAAGLSGI